MKIKEMSEENRPRERFLKWKGKIERYKKFFKLIIM